MGIKGMIIRTLAALAAMMPLMASGADLASQRRLPLDLTEARALADSLPLADVEGIWEYPEDRVKVMVLRERSEVYSYTISVVESDDVRLRPGTLLGTLAESAKPGVYSLKHYTTVKGGALSKMADCKAEYDKRSATLIVEAPKIRMHLSPGLILPLFWQRLRLITRLRMEDPASEVPQGLRKIYPSPHGIDARRLPIYL